ncbi:MAG: choloylglycine hydrolase [Clostridia bacterium]|nr:choloylglycine hydrolase [Clostridia bacterium]
MCTALTLTTRHHYFGRNLDLECSYGEAVIITPRNCPLPFRCQPAQPTHHAIIGAGIVADGYPLYYDATNEHGLSMAGLNFPGNATYFPPDPAKTNVAPFELIPWLLGQCSTLAEARPLLSHLNLADIPFSDRFPLSPLHWLLADQTASIVLESTADGLHIYDNPIGVLTNNPPFPYHMQNLANYMHLTNADPQNRLVPLAGLRPYSRGMGALGLPGDLSSASRFVRATFHRMHSHCDPSEETSVSQFFHLLGAVTMPEGSVLVGDKFERTVYSSCCNMDTGTYYYTTYSNPQITAVRLNHEDLSSSDLIIHPFITQPQFHSQN